jgi:membrane-bound lytic murein transglycosylase B
LWGIESDFGRLKGTFPVIDVLATLAYDGRRPDYFREELLNALVMVDKGMVQLPEFIGSWAGAMGQTQFMPSTFLKYAVDQSADGNIDLWNTVADALGSGANYINKSGWRPGETWGREVAVPKTLDASLLSLDVRKPIKEWHDLGVRRPDGRDLPGQTKLGSIVRVEDATPRYFLVYDNFRVIREWNRSNHFAATVGLFANSLGF